MTLQAIDHPTQNLAPDWWKNSVVYQIYPRSFLDSNHDGIGDLPGIIQKLDYLQNLGVDVIWLSPHFDSPNVDNGYDIRDYQKVMAELGTMADFDALMAGLKARKMHLIIDLVVNHTSDQHAWFQESSSSVSEENPYRDYYIWRDPVNGAEPNNYPSFFGGSAWEYCPSRGQYYLHYFAKQQPDLNWENPKVRQEVYELMRFWLNKGVSGFRMDVIPFISKPEGLPNLTAEEIEHPEFVYANGPRVHEYLQELHQTVLAPFNAMTVGEAFGVTFENAPLFTDASRKELSMIFHFDVVRLDRDNWRKTNWTLAQLKSTLVQLDSVPNAQGWNTSFLCNHDNPRIVSHFGNDSAQWRDLSAKALAMVYLCQRATPFIYQGDELGMTNFPFTRLDQYNDLEVKGMWDKWVATGKVSEAEYLSHQAQTSRDHARTPMQWSNQPSGGFSNGQAWLEVNPNYTFINAEDQIKRSDSVYCFYKELIQLRKQLPVLVHGVYQDLAPEHAHLYVFQRLMPTSPKQKGSCIWVAINFSEAEQVWEIPAIQNYQYTPHLLVLLDNYTDSNCPETRQLQLNLKENSTHIRLKGWQALLIEIHD